jgi:NADH:ubiquinone oxidoreductase subunit 2 (subunit N)
LKDKQELYTLIINDFLYICALISFLLYHYNQNSITEEQRYKLYGFSIIGILGMIIAMNLLIGFYVMAIQIKSLCSKKQKPKNKISGLKNLIRDKTLKKRQRRLKRKNRGAILAA